VLGYEPQLRFELVEERGRVRRTSALPVENQLVARAFPAKLEPEVVLAELVHLGRGTDALSVCRAAAASDLVR
jgi:hypothetical protein